MGAERVVSPSASINVQQFELAVSRVKLEFNFNQTVIIDAAKEAAGQRLKSRQVNRFDEGTGSAKVMGMLASATCDHAADRFVLLEKRAIAELLTTVSGNHVLR